MRLGEATSHHADVTVNLIVQKYMAALIFLENAMIKHVTFL